MHIHHTEHRPDAQRTIDAVRTAHQRPDAGRAGPGTIKTSDAGVPVPEETPPDEVRPTPEPRDDEDVQGVIRLLETGHFKGVADVRLRINFFEEMSSRAAAAVAPVVEEQSDVLAQTLSDAVAELLAGLDVDDASGRQVDESVTDFGDTVRTAAEEFNTTGTLDTRGLAATITSAFNALVDSIRNTLAAPLPEPSPPPDPEGADTSGEDPAAGLEDAMTVLREIFERALGGLLDSMRAAAQAPDLSLPNGSGVAYDKFLGIYNRMLDGASGELDYVG